MSGNFQEIEDATSAMIDAAFDEAVRFTPMRAGQYSGPTPDPARPAFDARFVVVVGPFGETNLAGHNGATWSAKISVGVLEAHVDTRTVPAAVNLKIGDRVELLDRGGARYEIARVDSGMRHRLSLRLNAI